ncbi:iron transporter [Corynebacterium sp. TAE3-ERU12]|uniref:iron transporter n=1 Tax=Corynebacterium sp. TAE3-ERU12 TaxID=2849491 RepID=UPI001C474B5E|nr:iron transporter [Corynebacterium sp. TAE3-ERU12]MBV7295873.1 iron transporter [Corynebacterium sp. TAE3-ERU12]
MKTTNKRVLAAVAVGVLGLAGCADNDGSVSDAADAAADSASSATEAAKGDDEGNKEESGEASDAVEVNARPDECGLQEQEGPTASFGLFDAAVMFFQPGQMAPNPNSTMEMLDYDESQMHIELDLKANAYATNWGYSVDETPANLKIAYKIETKDGDEVDTGMMMPMNAIDGSHYGTNLAKDTIKKPGDYKLTVTIFPPSDYDIHSDYITGVPATEWFGPLTRTMDWKITQENLDAIEKATVKDPMTPPEECKDYQKKMFEDKTAEKNLQEAEDETPLDMPSMGGHSGHSDHSDHEDHNDE